MSLRSGGSSASGRAERGPRLLRSEASRAVFDEAAKAVQEDMPLLMHGCGDVVDCHPESARLVSELTLNYVGNLVNAAVEAHAIMNGRPAALPPPRRPDRRIPSKPIPYEKSEQPLPRMHKKKRRRAHDEYFDEPLDEPNIRGKTPSRRHSSGVKYDGVDIDEWVGVSGVDFWEESRVRKAHLSGTHAIGSQCFIFPICHDSALYGKVCEIQQARRLLEPVLTDKTIINTVRSEGSLQGPASFRRRRNKKKGAPLKDVADASDPTESDSDEEGATWPGLDHLLPTYTALVDDDDGDVNSNNGSNAKRTKRTSR